MSAADPDTENLIGRLLGARYRIEARLARGGMASVFRAVDERLERPVAVKALEPPYADDPDFVERFLAEARAAASLTHPNLAHVYDSGIDGDVPYMVLELLEQHRSLHDVLASRGPLPPLEAARIALDVLAGLEPLHERGLVHCDIKPGNVMIGPEGTKLIDFGIARERHAPGDGATSIGSLHAMSPEQLRGEALTPASDLFAVGVLLYRALTGEVPFAGSSSEETAAAQAAGPAASPSQLVPDIHPRMDKVVMQALRVEPSRRFASARAMATALRSVLEERDAAADTASPDETTQVHPVARAEPMPVPAAPAGPAAPAPGPAARRRRRPSGAAILAAVAAVAVPALVAGIVLLGAPNDDPAPTRQPAAGDTPRQTPTLAPGTVRVPNTIGMDETRARAAAQDAGLAWRIEWRVVPGRSPGIYDQDPAAGEVVERGSPFVMYAYRSR